jgi:Cft2 family RNA processing exonuclease
VEVAGRKLVVDCGIRLSGPDPLPWMQPIQDAGGADAILLTHAHLDHCGALPLLVQTEQVPLYMTPPTRHLMRIMLQDSLKIMAIEAESEGEIPLYPAAAVEQVIARSNTVQWFEPLDLFGGEVRLTYFPAGHILGASSILVESEEGTILMGGDIALTPQRSIPGADWSKIPKRVDACVCESTYGGRAHASRSGEEMRLIQQAETVIGRGGTMVIPAFRTGTRAGGAVDFGPRD